MQSTSRLGTTLVPRPACRRRVEPLRLHPQVADTYGRPCLLCARTPPTCRLAKRPHTSRWLWLLAQTRGALHHSGQYVQWSRVRVPKCCKKSLFLRAHIADIFPAICQWSTASLRRRLSPSSTDAKPHRARLGNTPLLFHRERTRAPIRRRSLQRLSCFARWQDRIGATQFAPENSRKPLCRRAPHLDSNPGPVPS